MEEYHASNRVENPDDMGQGFLDLFYERGGWKNEAEQNREHINQKSSVLAEFFGSEMLFLAKEIKTNRGNITAYCFGYNAVQNDEPEPNVFLFEDGEHEACVYFKKDKGWAIKKYADILKN